MRIWILVVGNVCCPFGISLFWVTQPFILQSYDQMRFI